MERKGSIGSCMHSLAIDHSAFYLELGERGIARGGKRSVQSFAARVNRANVAPVDHRQQPVSVEFDFMHPLLARGRLSHERGKLRWNEIDGALIARAEFWRLCLGGRAGFFFSAPRASSASALDLRRAPPRPQVLPAPPAMPSMLRRLTTLFV